MAARQRPPLATITGVQGATEGSKLAQRPPVVMNTYEVDMAKKAFAMYDFDGSAKIDLQRTARLLQDLNLHIDNDTLAGYIKSQFETGVTDNKINFGHFCTLYCCIMGSQNPGVRKFNMGEHISAGDLKEGELLARKSFEAYDADDSGYLDDDEIKSLFADMGLPDHDGDNYVQLLEKHMETAHIDISKGISYQQFIIYRNAIVRGIEEESNLQETIY